MTGHRKVRTVVALVCGLALSACGATVLESGGDRVPAMGFAGSRVERKGQKIFVKDASGMPYLMVRARPFSNTNLVRHVKVEVDDEGVTIDARAAFAAGAVDIPIDPITKNWKRERFAGKDCLFLTEWSGENAALRWDICGEYTTKGKDGFRRRLSLPLRPRRHVFESAQRLDEDIKYVGSFMLLTSPGKGAVKWYGLTGAPRTELAQVHEEYGAPKLLFHADFDEASAVARFAKGEAAPVAMEGVEFVPGGGRLGGGALRFTRANRSRLVYRTDGNVRPYCGAVAFWAKEADASISNKQTRTLFDLTAKDGRAGAGDVEMGWDGNRIRALRGDYQKTDHVRWGYEPTPGWHHYIFVWCDTNKRLESFFIDGQSVPPGRVDVAARPTSEAIGNRVRLDIDRRDGDFPVFSIGSKNGEHVFEGLVDDVRVYSAPLDIFEARAIFNHDRAVEVTLSRTFAMEGAEQTLQARARVHASLGDRPCRYLVRDVSGKVVAASEDGAFRLRLPAGAYRVCVEGLEDDPLASAPCWVLKPGNPHELPPVARAGVPTGLKLVSTWKAGDETLGKMKAEKRFRAVGRCTFGELDGRRYLESGCEANDRFALRFKLRREVPLHCFEFDCPDDKARTNEIILEPCKKPHDHYEMQCGTASGLEHRLTNRMLTHRTLYWTTSDDVSAVFRCVHGGQPAAVAEVRVYEVETGAIPSAAIPPAKGPTPRRSFVYYSEDMPINDCFMANQTSPGEFDKLFNRLAATMKYVGQDTLAYPAVWYAGIVEGTGGIYNLHQHAKDYLQGIFEKFDREGLSFIPLVHRFAMPYPQRNVTRERMSDGSLHESPVAIFDTGLPNWGGVHFSCSDFNIQHPLVQKRYLDDIDYILAQGRGHASFRGIGFHLAKYSPAWYGGLESGYNDYSVAAFERATGVKVPADRADPLRGKVYAKWIRANCREKWIDWRCDVLADFYGRIAAKMRAVDPKLKLWLNCWPMFFEYPERPDIMDATVASRMFREYGIDGAKLRAKVGDGLVLGTMDIPAWSRDEWPGLRHPEPAKLRARDMPETADFYRESLRGGFPAVAHFDSYFESAVGETKGSNVITCDWMTELGWRVACLNPSGRNVLARYAIPLKFADVMLFSKGGFLCGLYGTEETLAPWMQNFRALPAVPFEDIASGDAAVTVRRGEADGVGYWYFVNTTAERRDFAFALPEGTCELVSGKPARGTCSLDAYELISFSRQQGNAKGDRQ